MPEYLVMLRRVRTVYEHVVVKVKSSSNDYAERDAKGRASLDGTDWTTDAVDSEYLPSNITSVRGDTKAGA